VGHTDVFKSTPTFKWKISTTLITRQCQTTLRLRDAHTTKKTKAKDTGRGRGRDRKPRSSHSRNSSTSRDNSTHRKGKGTGNRHPTKGKGKDSSSTSRTNGTRQPKLDPCSSCGVQVPVTTLGTDDNQENTKDNLENALSEQAANIFNANAEPVGHEAVTMEDTEEDNREYYITIIDGIRGIRYLQYRTIDNITQPVLTSDDARSSNTTSPIEEKEETLTEKDNQTSSRITLIQKDNNRQHFPPLNLFHTLMRVNLPASQ
jgi:hypothetical protein